MLQWRKDWWSLVRKDCFCSATCKGRSDASGDAPHTGTHLLLLALFVVGQFTVFGCLLEEHLRNVPTKLTLMKLKTRKLYRHNKVHRMALVQRTCIKNTSYKVLECLCALITCGSSSIPGLFVRQGQLSDVANAASCRLLQDFIARTDHGNE